MPKQTKPLSPAKSGRREFLASGFDCRKTELSKHRFDITEASDRPVGLAHTGDLVSFEAGHEYRRNRLEIDKSIRMTSSISRRQALLRPVDSDCAEPGSVASDRLVCGEISGQWTSGLPHSGQIAHRPIRASAAGLYLGFECIVAHSSVI